MGVVLKLIAEETDEGMIQAIKLIKGNTDVDLKAANAEGISIDEVTMERLRTLVLLGQRYEEIAESQKSEFSDLDF